MFEGVLSKRDSLKRFFIDKTKKGLQLLSKRPIVSIKQSSLLPKLEIQRMLDTIIAIVKNPILCGMVLSIVIPTVLLVASELDDYFFDKKLATMNQNK